MHKPRTLIKPIALSLSGALVIGLPLGKPFECLTLALAGLLIFQLKQLLALKRWLDHPEQDPPEAKGVWGDVFDGLYHRQRKILSQERQLRAVIARMQDSTSALKDGVIMLDANGNLEWWNPSTERLLGLKHPQDVGQPITNLIRHPHFKAYFEQGQYQETLELASPVQDALHLQYHITEYGEGLRLILVRDVTHVHSLEQMRKDFVANVSHELRTPLTVISGYLETLIEHNDALPARFSRALSQMQQQSLRMQLLIDDLLLLARLEATEPLTHAQSLQVAPLLARLCQDAQLLGEQEIHLEADPALAIKGHAGELESAFANLIFNAVKYTPQDGRIEVRWYQDAHGAHLCVRDSGIGIEAKHLPRLTERFYRVDSSRHSATGGTGLGLAIVKHVLLRHNAQLRIESCVGVGSAFYCDFPSTQITGQAQ